MYCAVWSGDHYEMVKFPVVIPAVLAKQKDIVPLTGNHDWVVKKWPIPR